MIDRYAELRLMGIWCDENKLALWQKVELAAIAARCQLGRLPEIAYGNIRLALEQAPFTPEVVAEWLRLEGKMKHDLNAFVAERRRHLPTDLQGLFHQGLTSFDTEESAFIKMLDASVDIMVEAGEALEERITILALRYRSTIMNGWTHGQEAELQTFGKRCLTWLVQIRQGVDRLRQARENLQYSKLSGAMGNYTEIDPELERVTLGILELRPFHGATQIMPREVYLPVADALCQLIQTAEKIATDIRLAARSDVPLMQEPFSKKQTGSSVMPHKKNPVSSEKVSGMARLAIGYLAAIRLNILTWEERAIEQSSVERVAWPDLFHVVVHGLETLERVLAGLNVYPDNMLREIVNSRGCYAAGSAKVFLAEKGQRVGLSAEDAYRIIQLAAFNVFAPEVNSLHLRQNPPGSLAEADQALASFKLKPVSAPVSIESHIREAKLFPSPELAATEEEIVRWDQALVKLFQDSDLADQWATLFTPSHLLRNEKTLFQEILGV